MSFLTGLFLSVGLAGMESRPNLPGWAWPHDITQAENPYARVEIGWASPEWRTFRLEVAASHESSISTGYDRGINQVEARVRWTPFAR